MSTVMNAGAVTNMITGIHMSMDTHILMDTVMSIFMNMVTKLRKEKEL